ncbi:hypothetical protein QBC47DRAFT_123583 [Echria macrotheca]|uniref:Uncharacterized protein n=1 Tax=Echria macrotheca TaxID=438768 RepID=A0AAJ0B249_9PEZI|nr:hypothetical protein QBC47DRAFT_123583 [Echria macrotheca]
MPSRTNSVVKPAGTVTAKRFELPILEFKFASLTEGTDIPPPPPSPIKEESALPKTPNGEAKSEENKTGHLAANGMSDAASPKSNISKTSAAGVKRRAEDGPSSPTLSNRPGSIRRLFSRNLLNNAYANGEEVSANGGRPPSRSTMSVADSRKAKRSSGWFTRFKGGDNKRASVAVMSPTEEKKNTGPPPPMIPELSEIKSKLDIKEDPEFGSDLFKNIK